MEYVFKIDFLILQTFYDLRFRFLLRSIAAAVEFGGSLRMAAENIRRLYRGWIFSRLADRVP